MTSGPRYPELAGTVAAVSGGASGIGEASVRALAEQGATVWMLDIDSAAVESTRASLLALGLDVNGIVCDVSDEASVVAAITRILAESGRLDTVHCNAAVTWTEPVSSTTLAGWKRVIDINLTGAFLLAKEAYLAMRTAGNGGSIIFTGSPHALRTIPESSAYSASKGGVAALMKALAIEAAPFGIRVNSVLPGAVDTPLLRSDAALSDDPEAMIRRWGASRPVGRIGKPDEIASVVAFLASEGASYMSGSEIMVDGGLYAYLGDGMKTIDDN
ncbi:SDR family oxidoreductase [Lysinibacter cavernae]|uniref:NAD(P)-dependent dehydrogenase (Short-subunit alcohol dehydrogenase family) n=1 Tax=Lysinibacter cavernae TaxID=1640652 RepID=A0A7X5R2F3_9MICO|nr:NAD(P)-dependent dehydrogenase (short-subunit alcohol dehydrogenase family) [Lysinibacter cavernae]